MMDVTDAVLALGVENFYINGEPTNETEFLAMFVKVTGVTDDNVAITSTDPSGFGVTWAQVEAKLTELQAEADATEYQRLRKAEYDELNQYDLMYQDKVDGTNKWGEAIEAIKAKYPKPTEESDA